MQARSIYGYYWFGTCLRYLLDATAGSLVGKAGDGNILDNVNQFYKYLDDLGLQVTHRASSLLLGPLRTELATLGKDTQLGDERASSLRGTMRTLRTTLEAEIQGVEAYVVAPKRLDVTKLLDDVPGLFAPGVYDNLPEVAKFDVTEAGKCVAFERSTAGAFHLLRATEDVLRAFYRKLVRQNRVKPLWGPIVEDLRKRRSAKPYTALLNHLDHIRDSFRNPTQHPDKIYDIQEVQDLWSLCVDAMNRMAKAL